MNAYKIAIASGPWQAVTYDEAVLYCRFLDQDGFTDWRLPTRNEYESCHLRFGWTWCQDKQTHNNTEPYRYWVTPVRTIGENDGESHSEDQQQTIYV